MSVYPSVRFISKTIPQIKVNLSKTTHCLEDCYVKKYLPIENIRRKQKFKSLCLNTHHGDARGLKAKAPRILSCGTRWRLVVSFMIRLLYPRRMTPWNTTVNGLGEPQSRSGRNGNKINPCSCRELKPGSPARRHSLCWVHYSGSNTCTLRSVKSEVYCD
jgi:hypothetical protein